MQTLAPLTEENRLWFQALDVSIWSGFLEEMKRKYHSLNEKTPLETIMAWITERPDDFKEPPHNWRNPSGRRIGASRSLTEEEWAKIKGLIERHSLVCALGSGPYGGVFMKIAVHGGEMDEELEWLAVLDESHLPGCFKIKFGSQGMVSDQGWNAFSAIACSPRNIAHLQFYKLELPKERSYYDY